jgi:hypothetical protein
MIRLSVLITLGVWALFTWPLPKYLSVGIPSSYRNIEKDNVRAMIHGDHLQLLYHFWLAADTLSGHTPLFYNLYEFNTGNDAERYSPMKYYAPFSLFYALGARWGTRALGWNLAAYLAICLTFLFTWLLTRRYTTDPWLAAAGALVSVVFPYRWVTLLDGSPTGFGMMWIPLVFLGVELWATERRAWGAFLGGLAVYLCGWVDAHILFFAAMAAPFWAVWAYGYHRRHWLPRREKRLGYLWSAWPLLLFGALVVAQALAVRHGIQDTALAVTGRSLNEVNASSPAPAGILSIPDLGASSKIYLGWALPALALLGLLALGLRAAQRRPRAAGNLLGYGLLVAGAAAVVLLALGTKGPGGTRFWRWLMDVVPPYNMIRQPAKIYCLLPTLLAVVLTIGLTALLAPVQRTAWRRLLAALCALTLLLEYDSRIDATICLLDREQAAYAAVADDARAAGWRAHLLALPLWPGNSAYTSLNEYYVSLDRIRMVNGYRPTVRTRYFQDIFLKLESLNQGVCTDAQLDELLARGIHYVVLHENVFPEKVSLFPVGQTLAQLLNHPRLQCLSHAETVRAFKILPQPEARPRADFLRYAFPARRWEMEATTGVNAAVGTGDPTASGGGYVTLAQPGAVARTGEALLALDQSFRWWLRVRGQGALECAGLVDGAANAAQAVHVATNRWEWRTVPLQAGVGFGRLGLRLENRAGAVDLDLALLTAGDWRSPRLGETVTLPPSCFFHAGYTAPDLSSIVLRKDYDPVAIVFYGPMLPLEAGVYELELTCAAQAPAGTLLGKFNTRWTGREDEGWTWVRTGAPARRRFIPPSNLPFFLAFVFARNADVEINGVNLTRVK